jgi:hypothetical protein
LQGPDVAKGGRCRGGLDVAGPRHCRGWSLQGPDVAESYRCRGFSLLPRVVVAGGFSMLQPCRVPTLPRVVVARSRRCRELSMQEGCRRCRELSMQEGCRRCRELSMQEGSRRSRGSSIQGIVVAEGRRCMESLFRRVVVAWNRCFGGSSLQGIFVPEGRRCWGMQGIVVAEGSRCRETSRRVVNARNRRCRGPSLQGSVVAGCREM